jgi:hypothetical protein
MRYQRTTILIIHIHKSAAKVAYFALTAKYSGKNLPISAKRTIFATEIGTKTCR